MRNKIIVGIALIVVFVLGILSVRAWDRYEVSQRVQSQYAEYQREQETKAVQRAEQKRQQVEAAEKQRLIDECQDGVKAFDALTPAQRTGKSRPVCNLQQVQ